ncbi:hypothetical protein C2G38_2178549 [Gigaspora rosea]|uniref:Uncharacterized protein n=1 Tax=Gigaspora rosea TaxID=44941 RepID=A0A397VHF7_9GLOM|nr:hypothetical protein C2G38_2178549 [Gigaspora rosea]
MTSCSELGIIAKINKEHGQINNDLQEMYSIYLDKVSCTINLSDIGKHTSKKINIIKLAECKNNNNNLPLRHDIKVMQTSRNGPNDM